MANKIFSEEHEIFRDTFRKYVEREVVPHLDEWEKNGAVPREAWKKLAEQGYLCPWLAEEYGGFGAGFEYSVIITEELTRARAMGFMVGLHSDIVVPYINSFGNPEQKKKWLPGAASGDCLMAVAMTEPDTGSDLQAIRTKAVKDGDQWVINGQKTFISNGYYGDLVIVACKTDPQAKPAHQGISLIVVENGAPGYIKGRKLEKMGLKISDTAELIFEDCRVPAENLLGEENKGFLYLMQKLQQERLVTSIMAQSAAEAMLDISVKYARERQAFGRSIGSHQHNTFKLVEMATEVELGRSFLNDLIYDHCQGKDIVRKVSMAKYWIPEMANRIAYHGVQLHGGYGYMEEYSICRWYRDIRCVPIFAGTSEIMKQIVGKMMGF